MKANSVAKFIEDMRYIFRNSDEPYIDYLEELAEAIRQDLEELAKPTPPTSERIEGGGDE